jgi:hypothetical protein
MVAKTNKRSVKKVVGLSNIFGDLPDMLKQQVLEFATSTKDPFYLCYSPKTKTFVRQMNRNFMKEILEFKINNPPIYTNHGTSFETLDFNTPPKIHNYGLTLYRHRSYFGWTQSYFVNKQYQRLFNLIKRKYGNNKKTHLGEKLTKDTGIMFVK